MRRLDSHTLPEASLTVKSAARRQACTSGLRVTVAAVSVDRVLVGVVGGSQRDELLVDIGEDVKWIEKCGIADQLHIYIYIICLRISISILDRQIDLKALAILQLEKILLSMTIFCHLRWMCHSSDQLFDSYLDTTLFMIFVENHI